MRRILLSLLIVCFALSSQAQNSCATALPLNPGIQQCGINSFPGSFPDDGISAPLNPCSQINAAGEYWFSWTGDGHTLQLVMTGLSNPNAGVFVLDTCPGASPNCIASHICGSSTSNFILTTPVLAVGHTYYIVVASESAPYSTSFCLDASPLVTLCAGQTLYLTVTDTVGGASYFWTGPDGFMSSMMQPSVTNVTASSAGVYTCIVSVGGVNVDTLITTLVVNPVPVPLIGSNTPICAGNTLLLTSSGGTSYIWSGPNSFSSNLQNPSVPGASSAYTGTYTVTVTGVGGCTASASTSVVVSPLPVANLPASFIVCNNEWVPPDTLTSTPPGAGVVWSNSNTSIGLPAFGFGIVPGFTAVNNGSNPVTANLNIVLTLNGCAGPPAGYSITVYPTPQVNFPPLPSYCGNGSPIVLNTATPPGGTYSGPGVSGNIFDPNAVGTGTFTITYSYTDANGCSNTASQTVSVNPPDDATFSYAPDSVCQSGTDPVPTINGPYPGTFSSTPAGLAIDPSSGVVNASASTPGDYSVTFTTNGPCPNSSTVTFSVNPKPEGTFSYNGPYCQSDPNPVAILDPGSTAGVFSGSSGLVIGDTTTGLVNLSASGPGTYTVTNYIAAANGCAAVTETAQIIILPSPIVTVPPGITACNSANVPATNFTSTPPGATFTWTNSNTAIGLPASGTGDIGSFTVVNNGTTPITATITVTPTLDSCPGIPSSYTITVNPTPTANMPPDLEICHNETASAGAFSSPVSGTTYTWSNSDPSIGLAASGNGNVPGFTAINNGTTPITVTITVTPTANGCTGPDSTFTITVNPLPVLTFPPLDSLCPTSPPLTLDMATPPGGTYSGPGVSGNLFNPATTGPGTYTLTYSYTDANGCTNTATQTITVNSPDNPSFSFTPSTLCQTGPDVAPTLSGGFPGTFTFSPAGLVFIDDSTGLIDVSASTPGTYSVTYTTEGPCPQSASASITIIPPPQATFTYDNPYCQSDPNPIAILDSGSTAGVFSSTSGLVFSSTSTGQVNLGGSTPGTYTVANFIAAANGCAAVTETAQIIILPSPIVTVPPGITACNSANVPATNFTSTPPGATFTWTNSNTAIGLPASGTGDIGSFTVVNNGTTPITATITVTPTLDSCPGIPSSYTITVNPTPTANMPPDLEICHNETASAGAFSSPVSGTTYTWSNSDPSIGLAASGSGNIPGFTAINNGTTPITVTITVTPTANGCTGPDSTFTITVNPLPVVTFPPLDTLCPASPALTLNTATPPGGTYSGPGVSGNLFNPATTGPGTFTLTYSYTDANGCTNTATQTITVNSPDNPSFSFTPSTLCQTGPDVAPTLSGGFPGTFTFSPAGLVFIDDSTGLIDVSASTPGTYSVTYTTEGPCPQSASASITIIPPPQATFTYDGPYCQSDPNPFPILFPGSTSGVYSAPAGLVFVSTSTGQVNLGASTPGTYTVTNFIAAANGCASVTETAQITILPTPTVTVPPDITACNSANVPATNFTSTPPGATFTWTNSNTAIGLPASGTGDIGSFTVVNTGTTPISATITVTPTLDSCPGIPSSYTITVNPTPTVNVPPDLEVCNNQTANAGAFSSPVSGTTYTWSNSDPSIGLAASGSGNIPGFTAINNGTTPITVTITVTPTANGCTGPDSTFTITVNPLPVVTFPPLADVCWSAPAFQLITATPPGGTYSGPGVSGNLFNPATTGPGTYTLTYSYTDANGCTNSATQTITVDPGPTATFDLDPATGCVLVPVTATYTGNAGAGATFNWDFGGGSAIPGTGAGPHTITFDTTGSQTVTLIVTENGCSSMPYTQSVTINQVTTQMQVLQNVSCFGDTNGQATVIPGGGLSPYTYSWQTDPVQTTQIATGLAPGTYIVTVTDDAGCTAMDSITITEPAVLTAQITDSLMVKCFGASTGMAEVTANGGTTPYQYQWQSSSSDSSQATGYAAGNYSVTVTDDHGCSAVVPFEITQNPQINIVMFPVNEGCLNSCTGALAATASGGVGPYTYVWYPGGMTDSLITGLCAGDYTIVVTDSLQCTATSTSVIGTEVLMETSIGVDYEVGIAPATVQFTYTGSGGTEFYWDFGDGGTSTEENPSHTYTDDGSYVVVLHVNSGSPYFCEDIYILTLVIYPASSLQIPNVFTPNGDGYNDKFYVESEGLFSEHMVIMNRWGRTVWEWNSVDGSWDGLVISSGEEASPGVYYYVFDAIGYDKKEYHMSGSVTLLK